MGYWHYSDGGWIGLLLMLITMIVIAGGLVTVTVVLLRRYARPPASHDEAIRILNERFARGEIDKEEFEQRRAALRP